MAAGEERDYRLDPLPSSLSILGRAPRLAYVTAVALTQWAFLGGQNAFLRGLGFELHAIASPDEFLDRIAERDHVTVHGVPLSRRPSPIADLRSLLRLVRVLRAIRPDILHVSTPKAALLGALAGAITRVPIRVFLVRGLVSEAASGAKRTVLRSLERLTASLCHVSICVSPSLLAFARAEGIISNREGIVLGDGTANGIDADRFSPSPTARDAGTGDATGSVTLGYVGRLTRDKGIEDVAAAWETLRDRYPGLRLLLVGPWEEDDAVSPEVKGRLERDERVEVTGMVTDPAPYYRRFDIFVFASHREGFPNAPMEAAATALPVVASRVVGNVDAVVDGVSGTLVPPRQPEVLTRALQAYIDSPPLRRLHGSAGRDRVLAKFRQERIWGEVAKLYLDLLRTSRLVR